MGFLALLGFGKRRTDYCNPSSKSLPLALFPSTEYNVPAYLWANSIQALPESKECRIRRIVHCRSMSGAQREFLLVFIQHPSGKEAIMLVDRDPTTTDVSSPIRDKVKLSHDGTDRCVTRHISSWAEVHALKFTNAPRAPSVGHFAALLLALNRHHLPPELSGESSSAWFVYCAIEVLNEIFGGEVRKSKKWIREPYGGMKVDGSDSVEAVVREFTTLWEDFSRRRTQRGGQQSADRAQPTSKRREEKKVKKKEQMDSFADMLRTMEI